MGPAIDSTRMQKGFVDSCLEGRMLPPIETKMAVISLPTEVPPHALSHAILPCVAWRGHSFLQQRPLKDWSHWIALQGEQPQTLPAGGE